MGVKKVVKQTADSIRKRWNFIRRLKDFFYRRDSKILIYTKEKEIFKMVIVTVKYTLKIDYNVRHASLYLTS